MSVHEENELNTKKWEERKKKKRRRGMARGEMIDKKRRHEKNQATGTEEGIKGGRRGKEGGRKWRRLEGK